MNQDHELCSASGFFFSHNGFLYYLKCSVTLAQSPADHLQGGDTPNTHPTMDPLGSRYGELPENKASASFTKETVWKQRTTQPNTFVHY
ncbi:hypothetical protein JTE90_004830 [Oedothorax gibbosus]|uniref:Uncharacterized protein n=1 Tax=Oedothorax gibbosus TaxID=931172 RepID=A0AAV6USB5_9ARAC|nr:hypothetical protein JTE90_004830 [Oedothorax gibbosus]